MGWTIWFTLRRMYEAGAGAAFDVLAAHAYGWSFPADDPPDAAVVNFRRVELERAIMVEFGDAGKPAMITEGGWNDHPRLVQGRAAGAAHRLHRAGLRAGAA